MICKLGANVAQLVSQHHKISGEIWLEIGVFIFRCFWVHLHAVSVHQHLCPEYLTNTRRTKKETVSSPGKLHVDLSDFTWVKYLTLSSIQTVIFYFSYRTIVRDYYQNQCLPSERDIGSHGRPVSWLSARKHLASQNNKCYLFLKHTILCFPRRNKALNQVSTWPSPDNKQVNAIFLFCLHSEIQTWHMKTTSWQVDFSRRYKQERRAGCTESKQLYFFFRDGYHVYGENNYM